MDVGGVRGNEGVNVTVTVLAVPSRTVAGTVRLARVGDTGDGVAESVGVELDVAVDDGIGVGVNDGVGVTLGEGDGTRVTVAVSDGDGNSVDAWATG